MEMNNLYWQWKSVQNVSKRLQNTAYAVCKDTLYISCGYGKLYLRWRNTWIKHTNGGGYRYKLVVEVIGHLNSCNILNLNSWILKLMLNFPELIHIAAHLLKVVLRVAEGSTDKEEVEYNVLSKNVTRDVSQSEKTLSEVI